MDDLVQPHPARPTPAQVAHRIAARPASAQRPRPDRPPDSRGPFSTSTPTPPARPTPSARPHAPQPATSAPTSPAATSASSAAAGHQPPLVLGSPGKFVRHLLRRATAEEVFALGLSVIAAVCAGFVVTGHSEALTSQFGWFYFLLTMLAAVLGGVSAVPLVVVAVEQRLRAAAGLAAERDVARLLAGIHAVAVVHGPVWDQVSGDSDHLVLGPCAAVIETKAGAGKLTLKKGRIHLNRRGLRGDPIAQVRDQARRAQLRLGVDVVPVVCLPFATGPSFDVGGVRVCTAADLAQVIGDCPAVVSPDAALRMARLAAAVGSTAR